MKCPTIMRISSYYLWLWMQGNVDAQAQETSGGEMVKMCLFYDHPSAHVRSDPIRSTDNTCASDHVHTFYGPLEVHPDTTYQDLMQVPPELSTSPFVENQSLYWHPSIYEVTVDTTNVNVNVNNMSDEKTFTRVSNLWASPNYRWDNSVLPRTEAFPPGFRMIASSHDEGSDRGGEKGFNMFTECCTFVNGRDVHCETWNHLEFPEQACDSFNIAFAAPTCWNGVDLGDTNDHKSHMAYTLNGEVAGECPDGFHQHRLPQIQLFVRILNYKGGTYQLSSGHSHSHFHFDFFNGWQEGKLQQIIDNCVFYGDQQEVGEYNPPCDCTPGIQGSSYSFLTPNDSVPAAMCDADVRRLIINEATDVVTTSLPLGACQGPPIIQKSWDKLTADLFSCGETDNVFQDEDTGTTNNNANDKNGFVSIVPPLDNTSTGMVAIGTISIRVWVTSLGAVTILAILIM
eukprot:scaffold30375_cov55-Attheya_sp.AAC.2